MKTELSSFSKILFAGLLLTTQHLQAQVPEPHQDIRKPVDTAWSHSLAGDKLLANAQLLNPAGQSLNLAKGTRVLNLEFAQHQQILIAKTNRQLTFIDAKDFKTLDNFISPDKESSSMNGLTVDANDSTIYFTGLEKNLYIGNISQSGAFTLTKKIDLSPNNKKVNPLGIAIGKNNIAYVALAITNEIAVVDIAKGKVLKRIPVGVCPYAITISKDKQLAFVSNFGGPHPGKNDRTEKSAGTDVAVDDRSVALRGSVTVIDLEAGKKIRDITTRIHPESMTLAPDGKLLYVTDDSGDGISVIDTKTFKVVHTISTKPDPALPYGSLTTALAFSADGKTLFAANAGNNSIALIDPKHPQKEPYGFIAAGGFPGTIGIAGNNLFIGNVTAVKGEIQKVPLPANQAELDIYTANARKGFHFIELLRAQAVSNANTRPKPVPDKVGEPSSIKHVVYIIKENKKFDQVLGDFGKGNCDPKLVEFGREITPNTHALAKQFVLLDNYYCNGVNSSDGHQWAIQGITTPYHEKDFSNGHCAYDFGTDPLSYAGCGFIWNHLLRKGISFRNFGETDLAEITKGKTWSDVYNSWKNKNDSAQYQCSYAMKSLEKYSDLRYPGWNMNITDQVRADVFIQALKEYEAAGNLPEFMIVYLPNDHTSGYSEELPTPRAYVTDNDWATGRVVEALSKSSFWKDMAIFINEDDPQSGTDHVDGHRSFCLVAGPHIKRDTVISHFYNQSSVLHTICQIFGVQPMNQLVAVAPLMTECFNQEPDYTGYTSLTPTVAINELNPRKDQIKSKTTAKLAPLTQKMDFSKPDLIDKDALIFSEYVWSTIHGDKPFPKAFFGAHQKGLKALGLKVDPKSEEDDD
ncbi:alkaline phosphatase family protein [Chitinophaga sp. Cy-1792]|uniref:bifunctional YncE family protein/alkaline phosphatase family protein n=1 Tax=Chitinophaga sp. Cy-1792 TaxID=2608339 RepID=UPI00142170FA|nr:alkaline phosphatase family protein [Chitinophaga sp. Cy-1792]NIG56817.1 beta-propeller fold lactonase family protein [Chitinophaga sp. Cy-1792]